MILFITEVKRGEEFLQTNDLRTFGGSLVNSSQRFPDIIFLLRCTGHLYQTDLYFFSLCHGNYIFRDSKFKGIYRISHLLYNKLILPFFHGKAKTITFELIIISYEHFTRYTSLNPVE